jgi:hypothetical protein
MKNDANITHQENELHRISGTESVLDDRGPGGNNVASVNEEVAGKEALRSIELNVTNNRKLTDLVTGDESDPAEIAKDKWPNT